MDPQHAVDPASDEVPVDPPDSDLPIRDPSRYAIECEHGHGGLGRVLLAYDQELGRTIAIKEMLRSSPTDETRFLREARITARLEHPGIVPVYEAGRWPSGKPFYSMKLIEGRTLKELIAEKTTLEERLSLLPNVLCIADAVAFAHSHRVIHRDLKPSNIVVGDYGETVVIDWGLSKDLASAEVSEEPDVGPYRFRSTNGITAQGKVLGTPSYMSPEQAHGALVTEATDIYSLGAILYEVVSGVRPYQEISNSDPRQLLQTVRQAPPKEITSLPGGPFPAELVTIVQRSMARVPSARFASAAEVASELRCYQAGQLVRAHIYTPRQLLSRWARRHRTKLVALAATVASLAIALGLIFHKISAERDRARRRANDLLLQHAKSNLRSDPTTALAYLKEYPANARSWAHVRDLVAEAFARGVASHVFAAHQDSVLALAASNDGETLYSGSQDRTIRRLHLSSNEHEVLVRDATVEGHFAVSPRQELLVYESTDRGLRLVNLRTGHTRELKGYSKGVLEVTFSADGSLIAAGGIDGTVAIWNLRSGESWMRAGHVARVQRVRFSPDGKWLASSSDDGYIRLWDHANKRVRFVGRGSTAWIDIAFSAESELLAWSGRDGDLGIYDIDRREATTWAARGASLGPIEFSPDGRFLAACSEDRTTLVWEVSSKQIVRVLNHEGKPTTVSFSRDTRWLASADLAGIARVLNLETGAVRSLAGHQSRIYASQFAARAVLATGDEDGVIRLWSLRGSDPIALLGHTHQVFGVALSPIDDANQLATVSHDQTVRVWNVQTRSSRVFKGHTDLVYKVAYSPDGSLVASASHDGTVRTWNLATETARVARLSDGIVWGIEFSPKGDVLAAACADGKVWLIPTLHGEPQLVEDYGEEATRVRFSATGEVLISASRNGMIRTRDLQTFAVKTLKGNDLPFRALAISSEGKFVATGDENGTVTVWELASRTVVAQRQSHSAPVQVLAFAPNGRFVVSSAIDNSLTLSCLYEDCALALPRSDKKIRTVVVSPNSRLVAIGSYDGLIRLWDVKREALAVLRGHTDYVADLTFSLDSRKLVSTSSDRAIMVWSIDNTQMLTSRREVLQPLFSVATTALLAPGGRARTNLASPTHRKTSKSIND